MVVDTISDFLVSNNYTKKFIAIDYGLKHIGMAISDPSNIISVPYGTFTETLLFEKIIEIITNENVHGVVIGCQLYTYPIPRDHKPTRMPSSA